MNRFNHLVLLIVAFCFSLGCQKRDLIADSSNPKAKAKNIPPKSFFVENRKVPGVATDNPNVNLRITQTNTTAKQNSEPDPDNGDEPIILGQHLTNPYSVPIMQQAVNTLYDGNYPISATNLYVRFKPSSVEQFVTLEETEDLELQDYPMDYEVIQDGDYY